MSTLTFQIEDAKMGRLAEVARERGLQVEELLRQITDEFLSRPPAPSDTAFKKALTDSTRDNEELLRRLAK